MPQAGTDSEPLGDDPDVLRRRIRELELGERVDAGGGSGSQKKDPGADLRRLSNREKTMPVDRLRPRYSLRSLACLPRYVFLQVGVHSMGTIFRQHRRLVSSGNCAVGTRRPFFLGYLVMRACSLR